MWSVVLACSSAVWVQEKAVPLSPVSALKFEFAIAMPGVEGRIDHMALDPKAGLLWVAARDNDSVEVLELATRTSKAGYRPRFKPQGVVYVDSRARVAVTYAELELMEFLQWTEPAESRRITEAVKIDFDGDNVRWLRGSRIVLVGTGEGRLEFVDTRKMNVDGRVDLGAHPESFQVDWAEKRAWVNIPSKSSIAVVDLEAKKVARWIEVKSAKKNYPMALAEKDKRLLSGCREPAKLLVFDIENDALTAELPLSGDVDDIFVDDERALVYASCGEGFVDVFERTSPGAWKVKEKIATSAGARTCLLVASEKRLFVAVPRKGEQEAEVRVFSTAPRTLLDATLLAMRIVTWNVNSVRARLARVLEFLERVKPDVVCLQETKCMEDQFPYEPIQDAGYQCAVLGQKTYNGVAILSKRRIEDVRKNFGEETEARVISAQVEDVLFVNLYVVNGQEVGAERYYYKLDWLARVRDHIGTNFDMKEKLVVLGDFNITFDDRDVHDPDLWREKILCSTPEREALSGFTEMGLADGFRKFHQESGHHTWWDFRTKGFERGLGLRIDHVLMSPSALAATTNAEIDLDARRGEKPSDHAPVVVTM